MEIVPLAPDAAAPRPAAPEIADDSPFARLVDAAGDALRRSDDAERAFIAHRGGLQEMVVERARADIALQIATAGVARVTQAVQTLFGLQL